MITGYRCLACGGQIIETTEFDPPLAPYRSNQNQFAATTTLDHPGPSDAACRLVMARLQDEVQASLTARMRAAQDRLTETIGSFNRRTS